MTLLSLKHLGGDVVRCTADRTLALTVELELGSETKITNLDLHLFIDEEVTKLKISMDDAMAVQVFDGLGNLVNVALNLELVEALATSQKLVQRLILAKLQKYVNILSILKEVLEAHNVVLVE